MLALTFLLMGVISFVFALKDDKQFFAGMSIGLMMAAVFAFFL